MRMSIKYSRTSSLENFFQTEFPAYQTPTCQSFASLEVQVNQNHGMTSENLGFLKLRVGGKAYEVQFHELDSIFGFPGRTNCCLVVNKEHQRDAEPCLMANEKGICFRPLKYKQFLGPPNLINMVYHNGFGVMYMYFMNNPGSISLIVFT